VHRLKGISKDTVSDCFPIPRIDDLIDMIQFRLRQGVYNIRSDEWVPSGSTTF